LERMAGAALESAELRLNEIRAGSVLVAGAGLEAKLGQVEAEAEATMREDMADLGLVPDEATGDCALDRKGESVVRCGEYIEGLRSELGKLAEELRAGKRTSTKMAAVGLAAVGLVGCAGGLVLARTKRRAAKIEAKKRVAV